MVKHVIDNGKYVPEQTHSGHNYKTVGIYAFSRQRNEDGIQ